ncbi:unnamed protein product [Triticum turgidum subsp. durum]|uniref:C2 domain-containing protein n=1 Tax=Triticum turgidum subsp. durum TaxID=4567 RepID=A0A9R0ZK72_TRITD|nr:unnamed protein product [Triticum turgidum subsp. durum]
MGSNHEAHHEDFQLKDTNPLLGEQWPKGAAGPARPAVGGGIAGWLGMDKPSSTYDLVEQMFFLYVRVVKAKDLPPNPITGAPMDPYVEVKLGNYKGTTKHRTNPEWDQVFAFSKSRVQSNALEVYLKDRDMLGRDDYVGRVLFDLAEVPTRVPPDSPLAPQWYRLEQRRGGDAGYKVRGELMLAVWIGTQADEAFPEAWHSDAATVRGEGVASVRSKAYVSPKLWYLRVNVIEAQDVQPQSRGRAPEVFVKAQVGNQILKTSVVPAATLNPRWNEDLLFVVAEPFEEQLVMTVEDRVSPRKDDLLGRVQLPLTLFEKRLDHRPFVQSRWFDLEKFGIGPTWNEQYTWEVFDPSTVITIGVFDNCHLGGGNGNNGGGGAGGGGGPPARDARIGKIRIRLSTLETDRVYTHAYPLILLTPSGVKKMGELRLAVRFTCLSMMNMNVATTALVHVLLLILICYPELILPTVFLYMFMIGLWNYRRRPRHPPHMDTKMSWAEAVHPDELDEEFDTFPTSRQQDVVYMRYDRLRSVAGRIQTVVGDMATQGERLQSLLSWRDPRASCLFVFFCLIAAVVLYVTPFRVVALVAGLFLLRHPRFRTKLPAVPSNFFRRLPSRADSML